MPIRQYVTKTADDPDAYGPDGLLKDGFQIRVPMTAMDAAPRRAAAQLEISTGLRLDREFFPDGSPRERRPSRASNQQPAVLDAHRPGYRFADAAGMDARDAAYAEMCDDLSNAWKPAHMRVADARQAQQPIVDAQPPAGVSAGEWERHRMITEMSDAWKPRQTRDVAAPKILPFGAWRPGSQVEGSACSVGEGERGIWRREGDYLYCRPLPQPAVTVPPTNPSSADSVPRTMTVAEGQALKDRAWLSYVDDITNAWRRKTA